MNCCYHPFAVAALRVCALSRIVVRLGASGSDVRRVVEALVLIATRRCAYYQTYGLVFCSVFDPDDVLASML